MGDLAGFQDVGRNEWRRKDGAAIVAGWSRQHKGPIWRAWLPEEIIWIDDKSGAIVRRDSQREYGPKRLCIVRHRDWPRVADGRAKSLAEASTGTEVAAIPCEADEWFGTCYWHLQRRGIGRIQDESENGAEAEDRQACSSNNRPRFTATNGDALREQGAFYVASQMRHFINENVWRQVAPNRDSSVNIHLDDNTVLDADENPAAFFRDDIVSMSIHAHQGSGQQQVLMHEYGHYVVWTYDDVSNNCVQGSDEGDAIDETLANVFAGLYALASGDIKPQYGAYSGLGAPTPHTNAASILQHDVNCSEVISLNDPHFQGQAYEQAVWEIVFNRDCTIDNCTDMSGHGNRIWVGVSREDVIRHVGAALGFSLKVLGQNITHSQVAAQMLVKIQLDSGSATKNRAKSVFRHHGVL